MKQSQRIVKNAIFGVGGSVIGGLVYLATVLKIAHSASVTEFGKFSFVLAFAAFVSNLADSGLPRMLTREVAKDREGFLPVAGATFSLIWVISGAMCVLVCLVAPLLRVEWDVKIAIVAMSFGTLATFHASGYSAVLRAFEDNELNQLGFVLHKVFLLGFVVLAIRFRLGLIGIVGAFFLANGFLWAFYEVVVTRFYAKVRLCFDVGLWKELLVDALPLGSGVMLRQLALNMDVLVLTWLTNLTTVGLFSGPYRISMALRLIPQTLSVPLFPLFSRTAHFSPKRFAEVYQLSIKFFLLISIPIAAFFVAWSGPILRAALGKNFLPAIPAMQLLGVGSIPFFLSTLFQYLFAALGQQKRFLVSTCAGSLFRLVLLFVLIPMFGLVGPSIAFLISETLTVGIWIIQLARLGFPSRILQISWRPLLGGGVMSLFLLSAHATSLSLCALIAVAAMTMYAAILYLLRSFSADEISHAREGIGFVSPFIESWAKKIRRDT